MKSKFAWVVVGVFVIIAVAYFALVGMPPQSVSGSQDLAPDPIQDATLPAVSATSANTTSADTAGNENAAARGQLQSRLDAIAQAYNDGNIKAIELALWKNHAVVRPNGQHLDRDGVLKNWTREWTQFQNRKLALAIVSFEKADDYVNASWSIDLTADIEDEFGEIHKFKMHGLQEARYLITADGELLDGPITFAAAEQTMNGEPWSTQE